MIQESIGSTLRSLGGEFWSWRVDASIWKDGEATAAAEAEDEEEDEQDFSADKETEDLLGRRYVERRRRKRTRAAIYRSALLQVYSVVGGWVLLFALMLACLLPPLEVLARLLLDRWTEDPDALVLSGRDIEGRIAKDKRLKEKLEDKIIQLQKDLEKMEKITKYHIEGQNQNV